MYADGHQVDVPADSIDDAFVARLTAFMQKMTSGHAAPPSAQWAGVPLV